jgi:hypothetical protein
MDIDRSRASTIPRQCHRCGDTTHIIRDCPKRYDVRYLSGEEREEWLCSMLTERDVAEAQGTNSETSETSTIVEREVTDEDFVRSSG